ncbi:16S rRNA (cytosine(967)-C(5))-methyltransferase RsmB [Paenibacillus thermoaerophilus]|uniref:16S rRNA (cytosine(967)-C(5))-methyltransferase n=1 Tax=Paenibacillus thermoaerophilus TaxID=1215385 RepID=A0ABW2V3C0_9BACL|nr:16S rRNA (cytosine(967)-C(5))-methyltransferase RsmB [Paenibacillus thermoaerophilus]TMV19152.1 16S rRNA (cytosine(967)-C(5))-methyltransferase RsmB [Paenibacillus thermoaerophilus]
MTGRARPPRARMLTAREIALDILTRVETEGAYSNLLLNERLRSLKPAPQEAALATELTYGTIQRLLTLDYFLDRYVKKGIAKLEPWVRALLRLSLYQLLYMPRIPEHAAVSEAVAIAKRRGHAGIAGVVNGTLRTMLRERDKLKLPEGLPAAERISLAESHPRWLVERWIGAFGEATAEAMCRANNEPPRISARVNRLRGTRESLLDELRAGGRDAAPSEVSRDGIVVAGGGNLALTDWYASGRLSVQDESSMLVAEAVAPEPGMNVLDACAAPGGKASHLAERMGDRGAVWACDVHEHKVALLQAHAERLGLSSLRPVLSDARELSGRFGPESFDRVLLDAPCSGLGVLRRKPDARWRKTPDEIRSLTGLQKELLDSVAGLVAPGGLLVYSTCTTEPEENELQVRAFLQRHPQYRLSPFPADSLPPGLDGGSGTVSILPHMYGTDGFFIARMQKGPAL